MSMTCRDFERLSQELLDARDPAQVADLERALDAHASACPPCQSTWGALTRLQMALRVGLPPIEPASVEFLNRLKSSANLEFHQPTVRFWTPAARRVVWFSAAAGILALVGFGLRDRSAPRTLHEVVTARQEHPRPSLNEAFAVATTATLELAKEASAPAARLGRDVIDLPPSPLPVPDPERALAVDVRPASDALLSVGERVNQGVRPISGSARQAFGFLLGPSLAGQVTGNAG